MKKEYKVKLFGVLADGTKAKTHQAAEVVMFTNEKRSIQVPLNHSRQQKVITAKGEYILDAHESIKNLYTGITWQGIKMHFTKKKLVAALIYWA